MTKYEYEVEQVRKIKKWKKEKPGIIGQTFGIIFFPATWLFKRLVPLKAVDQVIGSANSVAKFLTDEEDIKREGKVFEIKELRKKDLKQLDRLADEVHDSAIAMAAAEGSATGLGGIGLLAVDIAAIITLALRTIHKIALCYGYKLNGDQGKRFALEIIAASGSRSKAEKAGDVMVLESIEANIAEQVWEGMTEEAAERLLAKGIKMLAVKRMTKRLGLRLFSQKLLQLIPLLGAAIGGSLNACYIKDVGWSARHVFQQRWLVEHKKLHSA